MKKLSTIYALICICYLTIHTITAQIVPPVSIPYAQDYEWAKSIGVGGTNADVGYAVTIDADDNVYTTGLFSEIVDFDPGPGIAYLTATGIDIFISKLDASGNFLWAKKMGGISEDAGYSIALDASENVYITGEFHETMYVDTVNGTEVLISAGGSDIFIAKLDTLGNFMWAKRMGGPSHDQGNSIALDFQGNVYVTGFFRESADFNPDDVVIHNLISEGRKDIFISKLDTSGNFMGAKRMGGSLDDEGNSITIDAGGNIYSSGYFKGTADFDPKAGIHNLYSAGGKDIFISKLDSSGNFVAAARMGGTASDVGNSIILDSNGNILTTGYFKSTADFDPKGGTYNLYSAGKKDIFISKLDASGNFIWAKNMEGAESDEGNSMSLDSDGNVYITGSYMDSVDFDPGAGIYNLSAYDHDDVFISKLDAAGNFVWAKTMGGSGNDIGYGIVVNRFFDVHTTGGFMETVDFDPGAEVDEFPSEGDFDIFVQKLSGSISVDVDFPINNILNVFPNPTTENVTLDLGQHYNTVTLRVKNFSGALVSTSDYKKTDKIDFSIEGNAGVYIVEVFVDNEKIRTLKVIKH